MSSDEKEPIESELETSSEDPDPKPELEPEFESRADDEPSESAAIPETQTPPPAKRGILGSLAWLLLLVMVLLLGAGAYYWQQNVYQPDLVTLREQVSALGGAQSSVTAAIDSKIASVESGSAATAASINGLQTQFESSVKNQDELRRSVSALYEKETQTSIDWILAEAEYLVLAATQRLALERDINTSLAALQAADQRLRSAEHPDLIPIRDQIIKDVTALESVNLPDIEGLAIYLAKTIDQVDQLPTKPIAEEITPFKTVRSGEYKAEDWRRLGYAIWTDLVDLVEVKDADLPDSVLFDPELRYFLQQNLRLEFASARLAVLRRDDANLEASIGLIKSQLNAYYDENDSGVTNILKRLDDAAQLELSPSLPSITGSLDVIRKYRNERSADAGSAP